MKKFAVCVALDVMTTGASGVNASYPPFESAALIGPIAGV